MASSSAWIDALRKQTIKNISHVEFVKKYVNPRRNIADCIMILQGLHYERKQYFFIRILASLYEPFMGPHYVQIGDNEPFWVHSLTAFRREFFGFTDKLSFERSVFICLSDGEIVRLKVARPYLLMINNINVESTDKFYIYKNPQEFLIASYRDIISHRIELSMKKEKIMEQKLAVRLRIRNHLVSSIQQLFCSYLRDYQMEVYTAKNWFMVDLQHALSTCDFIFSSFTRVNSLHVLDPDIDTTIVSHQEMEKSKFSDLLLQMSQLPDSQIIDIIRSYNKKDKNIEIQQAKDMQLGAI